MKTYDLTDQRGRNHAFEVKNLLLPRSTVCRIVCRIPGVEIKQAPRFLSWFRDGEDFCKFELGGKKFLVSEPFGDNSRFWVGPESGVWCPEVEAVKKAFQAHRPLFGLLPA